MAQCASTYLLTYLLTVSDPWNSSLSVAHDLRFFSHRIRRRAVPRRAVRHRIRCESGDAWRRTVPCRAGSGVKGSRLSFHQQHVAGTTVYRLERAGTPFPRVPRHFTH